ncbi:hypothetical protein KAU11_11510 [Candidatus Babeliales bacterium]|nr:hypothetical protein [Candidatus Babeliales bacterium]
MFISKDGYIFELTKEKLKVRSNWPFESSYLFGSDEFQLDEPVERDVTLELTLLNKICIGIFVSISILFIAFVIGFCVSLSKIVHFLLHSHGDTLRAGDILFPNNTMDSSNRVYSLRLSGISSCDLVITKTNEQPVETHTYHHTLCKKPCSRLSFGKDNNLIAYNNASDPVWTSHTAHHYHRYTLLLTDKGEVKMGERIICVYSTKEQNT